MERHHWFSLVAAFLEIRSGLAERIVNHTLNHHSLHYFTHDPLVIIFLFGIFLGRVGGTFWLWSGLQSLAVALVTVGLIYLIS